MSIKISGPRVLATSANTLLSGAEQASVSCRVMLSSESGAILSGPNIFGRISSPPFAIHQTAGGAFRAYMWPSAGGELIYSWVPVPDVPYHVAMVWDQPNQAHRIYLNGIVVASRSNNTPLRNSASSPIAIGAATHQETDVFFVDDPAIWSGVALTPAEVAALRDHEIDPTVLHPSYLAWHATADGSNGATVTSGDGGLVDTVGSLSLVPTGEGTADWSANSLDYTPPVQVAARVLKSGETIRFDFTRVADSQYAYGVAIQADPTIRINGGDPIQLTEGRASTDNPDGHGGSASYAMYRLDSAIADDAVVTWSAPGGWATTTAPAAAVGGADDEPAVNGVGQLNFTTVTPTMKVGLNIAEPDYGYANRNRRNMVHDAGMWSGWTARDANKKPIATNGTMKWRIPDATAETLIDDLKMVTPTEVPLSLGVANHDLYCFMWDEAAPANNSNGRLLTTSGNTANNRAVITEVMELRQDPPDGINRRRAYRVTRPANPIDYNLGLDFCFDRGDWENFRAYSPGNEWESDDLVDAVTRKYCEGARVIRFMDIGVTNNSPVAVPEHLRPATDYIHTGVTPLWRTITRVDPVPDMTLAALGKGWMSCLVTTDGPHGFYSGQPIAFRNCQNLDHGNTARIYADTPGGTAFLPIGSSDFWAIRVVNDTQFIITGYSEGVANSGLLVSANAEPTPQFFSSTSECGPSNKNNRSTVTVGDSYTYMCRFAASLGVDPYIHVPHAATDDCIYAIAEEVRDNLAAGHKVWVEYSNEIWNFKFRQWVFAEIAGNHESPHLSGVQWGVLRAKRCHEIFEEVLTAAGRPDDLVRVIALQFGAGGGGAFLDFCLANNVKIDKYAIASYVDLPAALGNKMDAWNSAQMHDFWQTLLTRTKGMWGLEADDWLTRDRNALASRYPNADLICYEGSLQYYLRGTAANRMNRVHDMFYHPAMVDTKTAYLTWLQRGGVETFLQFQLHHHASWAFGAGSWSLVQYHGQDWGYGDGSDGKANNLDVQAVTKASNVQQDLHCVSTQMQAFKNWITALDVVEPLTASGAHGAVVVETEGSIPAAPLPAAGTFQDVVAAYASLSATTSIASLSMVSPALATSGASLDVVAAGGEGGTSVALTITGSSPTSRTFEYFNHAEPIFRIAGKVVTTSFDFFDGAEPFITYNQVVIVSVTAAASTLANVAEWPVAQVLGDLTESANALVGIGSLGSSSSEATIWVNSDDPGYFRRGEPDRLIAGKASTSDCVFFRAGEPYFNRAAAIASTPSGSVLLDAVPTPADGALASAGISASSVVLGSIFPLAGVAVSASLSTDVRWQAAGLGIPGAMGVPYLSILSPPMPSPLIGVGTFTGGRVPGISAAKRYVPPSRGRGWSQGRAR